MPIKLTSLCFLLLSMLMACSLPDRELHPFSLDPNYSETADSIIIHVENPVTCPLRIAYQYDEANIYVATELKADEPWRISFTKGDLALKNIIEEGRFSTQLGTVKSTRVDSTYRYAYPFAKGKSYQVIQAYNGSLSHNNNQNRYALDLNLALKDTVCAARSGVVVGVIDGYDIYGDEPEYAAFNNKITIYHVDGSMAEYAHLLYKGALVKVGDQVETGQAIALSGNTGYTIVPQLHFNVLVPTEDDVKSLPIKFLYIDGKAITAGFVLAK